MSVRTERVGAMVREAIAQQFQRSKPEYLDGMISISSVKMSPDLRIAKVYVSIFRSTTDPELQVKRLNTHAPEIRMRLGGQIELRFTPELRFYLDDTLNAAEHIDSLLRSVRQEDEATAAARAARNAGSENHTDTDGAAGA